MNPRKQQRINAPRKEPEVASAESEADDAGKPALDLNRILLRVLAWLSGIFVGFALLSRLNDETAHAAAICLTVAVAGLACSAPESGSGRPR